MFVEPDLLNADQQAAVRHGEGPLLILAGAGSGKTATLACRVAHLIGSGVEPSRICLLTFTRRAAQEMLGRAGSLTTTAAAGQVWGGTFHAVANRVLRLHGRRLGLPPDFTVMDQGDTVDLLGLVRHDLLASGEGASQPGRRFPSGETLAAIYSRTVNTQEALTGVLRRDFPWCAPEAGGVKAVFEAYTVRKREQHLVDYDDLLVYWRALALVAGGAEMMARLWDHVLVDEYQDTNTLQADILAALRPAGDGVTVVGDDAQAIYGFRAATSRNILEFPDRFPGTAVVRLEQNYRSVPPILAVANAVMASAGVGFPKTLWSARTGRRRPVLRICQDEAGQAEAVCDAVLRHREDGVALRSQAVLFRAGHHADLLELALVRRNIPYVKYGGLKFLEAAHIRDLMALLRLLDNPWDELAWSRVLRLMDGVGEGTARRVMVDLGVRGPAPGRRRAGAPAAGAPRRRGRRGRAARGPGRRDAAADTAGATAGGRAPGAGAGRPRHGRPPHGPGRVLRRVPARRRHAAPRRSGRAVEAVVGTHRHPALPLGAGPTGRPGAAPGSGGTVRPPGPLRGRAHPGPARVDRGPGRAAGPG